MLKVFLIGKACIIYYLAGEGDERKMAYAALVEGALGPTEPVYVDDDELEEAWEVEVEEAQAQNRQDEAHVEKVRRPESLDDILRNWASLNRRERTAAFLFTAQLKRQQGRKPSVAAVARQMNLSRSMVSLHLRLACLKMGVDDKFELTGLVEEYHLGVGENLNGVEIDD